MNMLTDQDIKRIGEEMGKVLEQNLMPNFESIHDQFEKIDSRFETIDSRFEKIESRLTKVEATMVTKDYLDDKLAELRGEFFLRLKRA